MPVYLDPDRCLESFYVKIDTVDPNGAIDVATSVRQIIKLVTLKTHIFDDNLWK